VNVARTVLLSLVIVAPLAVWLNPPWYALLSLCMAASFLVSRP
jgi:hypothetical protein